MKFLILMISFIVALFSYFIYSWMNPECRYSMDCDYLYECVSHMCTYKPEVTQELCKLK